VSKKKIQTRVYKRILGLACFDVVMQMILCGYPIPTVADFIQNTKGESTDIKRSSLVTILSEFRTTIPVGEITAPFKPKRILDIQKDFSDAEQDLKDLSWAIDMLKQNVEAAYQAVCDSGYPSKSLQVDLDTMSRMILRRHEIKMDLGFGKGRNLGSLTVYPAIMRRVHDKHGVLFDEIIGNPEKLSQVVSGASRLLAAAREASSEVIEGEVVRDQ